MPEMIFNSSEGLRSVSYWSTSPADVTQMDWMGERLGDWPKCSIHLWNFCLDSDEVAATFTKCEGRRLRLSRKGAYKPEVLPEKSSDDCGSRALCSFMLISFSIASRSVCSFASEIVVTERVVHSRISSLSKLIKGFRRYPVLSILFGFV